MSPLLEIFGSEDNCGWGSQEIRMSGWRRIGDGVVVSVVLVGDSQKNMKKIMRPVMN